MKQSIKVIIFDLGRVLVDYDYAHYYDKLKDYSSLSVEEVKDLLDYSDLSRQYVLGQISPKDFYKGSAQRIKAKNLSFEKFQEMWKSILVSFNEEMEEVIRSVKPEIKLLILSNTDESFWDWAKRGRLIKEFFPNQSQRILSFELGLTKPDLKIYEEALNRAKYRADECIFIDDLEENLEQFRLLGGNTVRYNCRTMNIQELKDGLEAYNVFK